MKDCNHNSLETSSYCELPTMKIHQATSAPRQSWWQQLTNKKVSSANDSLIKTFMDKNATNHYILSTRDDSAIAYLALRNSVLVELHVYPSRVAACKQEARLLGDRAFNPGFCNWSRNDNVILDAITSIMETLMSASVMPRVVDLDHSTSATTEYVWNEAALKGKSSSPMRPPQVMVNRQVQRLIEQLMQANWLISLWVNHVDSHSSKYSHGERIALLKL